MFYNMDFTDNNLKFLFVETNRVLKNKRILSFSVRNNKDIMYRKCTKITENIYNINGFQIRFFTKIWNFLMKDIFEIKRII
jgi:hypothetical protein